SPSRRPSSYARPRLPRGRGRPRLALRLGEGQGGVDEADVRERLREVAQEGAASGVDLLGVEADVVGEGQEVVEPLAGRPELPHPRQHLDRPEAAESEGRLAAGQAVRPRRIAIEESVPLELAVEAREGRGEARRARVAVAVDAQEEERGVDAVAAQGVDV